MADRYDARIAHQAASLHGANSVTMFNSATVVSVGTEDQMQVVTVLLDDGTEKAFAALYSPVIVHTDPRKRLPLWTLQPGTVVNVDAPTHATAGWGFQIVEFSPVLEMEFVYTSYEGETRLRKAIPLGLRFEMTEWHGLQMIMVGWDTEKQAERSYALKDCVFKADSSGPFSAEIAPTREGFRDPMDPTRMIRLWIGRSNSGQEFGLLSYGMFCKTKLEGFDYTPIDVADLPPPPADMEDRLEAVKALVDAHKKKLVPID